MITKFGTLLAANGAYVKWQSSKRFMDAHFICYTLALRNTHVFGSLSTFRRHFIPYVGYSFCMFIVCHIGLFVCTFSSRWLFRTLARRIPMRREHQKKKIACRASFECTECIRRTQSNNIFPTLSRLVQRSGSFPHLVWLSFNRFFFIVSFKLVYLMWSSFLALFYLPLLIKICIYVHRPWEFVVYTLNDNTKLKCLMCTEPHAFRYTRISRMKWGIVNIYQSALYKLRNHIHLFLWFDNESIKRGK